MSQESVTDAFPLSPMQQGMLFHSLYSARPGVNLEQVVIGLPEEIDARAMAEAWRWALGRHAILRTALRWEGIEQPRQEVHARLPFEFAVHDWSDLSGAARRRQFENFLLADRARGFRLDVAPLWRVALLQTGGEEHRLVFSFHHLLLDGRALAVLLNEALTACDGFRHGLEPDLPPPVPYRHYIDWLGAQDWREGELFWRRALRDFVVPTRLDLSRSTNVDHGRATGPRELQAEVPSELAAALRGLAKSHGLTLNTFVQGAWALLLGRYSGEDDVVFGAVRACRHSTVEGADSIVGLLINTLPLRVPLPPDLAVLAWLQRLRETWISLRPYEHTPLPDIQGWSEVPSGTPLFETIVSYQEPSWDAALQAQGGAWARRQFAIRSQPNYPLALDAVGGTALSLKIVFDASRFESATVRRMLGHLKTLLAAFAADPRQRLADLPLLTPGEHEQFNEWNRTHADYPRDRCVHQLFEAQASRTPAALAVADTRRQLSYRELDAESDVLARRLRTLGVATAVCVGVCLERSVELVVSLLAVLKAGGAYVPLDPAYPGERLAFLLEDAQSAVVVALRKHAPALASARVPLLCLDDATDPPNASARASAVLTRLSSEHLAYVIYTSGSTGAPKGVEIRHRSLVNLLTWHQRAYRITAADRATLIASPAFDASAWELWPYLAAGASIHIPDEETRVSPALLVRWLAARRITLSFLPTPLAEAVMDEAWPADVALRGVLTGGDKLRRRPGKKFPCALINHYGPTESTVVTTSAAVAPHASAPPPIGGPIANTEVHVLDHRRRLVPVGLAGELFIGGDGLARGYRQQPALTAEKFVRHPFDRTPGARLYQTGDLVRWREDGELEFLSRIDQQVKIRGHRIEPGEIEALLNGHPGVRESLVIAREDARSEPQLIAYLIAPPAGPPAVSDLVAFLRARLPGYMVPVAFLRLETWPLTPNGKIDRRALPAPTPASRRSNPPFASPRTPAEETVARVWTEVLGRPVIGVQDNFFELGGHSLRAAQVVSRLNGAFHLTLSVRSLFDEPTIAGLAREIEKLCGGARGPRVAGPTRAAREEYRVKETETAGVH
ncbi:MAG: amino acid adenylation domain-containing protein [Verrucomicrobia bacterium]|nr:amino acid adenylation domain-containing protein [Verrucomicrobiota bacterium]